MILPYGFHIEPTNICTLKCPECSRTKILERWPQHWKNHVLDIDIVLNFLDIDLNQIPILLCGNYGDPIYHPNFIEFVQKLKQRGAHLQIVTNGSYRKDEWWQELCNTLTKHDVVQFSIDGSPENFTQYRINGDWESIKVAIKVCVESASQTEWKYIPFKYNIDSIDQTKQLATELGIDRFLIKPSNRFNKDTLSHLTVLDQQYLRPSYQSQVMWKEAKAKNFKVDPECFDNTRHFISADGYYSGCCKIYDFNFYYKSHFGKKQNQYNITNTTITKILSNPDTIQFYESIPVNPEYGCQFNCPG
jgi:MoaA/NifB/PqqE/SkfB family radical SAM enzyme